MQDRLSLCYQHLKEIEARLLKLEQRPSSDPSDGFAIAEAVSFIKQAITAVSQTRERVSRLPKDVSHLNAHDQA